MTDSDKVKITINVAGEHIALSVDLNKQSMVRQAEKAAAGLYDAWRSRWPAKSDKEILAMVAYQFASYYQELLLRIEDATVLAQSTLARLDNIVNEQS